LNFTLFNEREKTMALELKERFDGLRYLMERIPGTNGKLIYKFSGPFQEMADVTGRKNRNGRRYTKDLWKMALADESVMERLKAKRMLGELDHPTDDGQIRRTSHIITDVNPDYEKGIVLGTLELLNHDQGDAALVKALVDQGVELCVSSRGFGDYLADGCTIDPKSYKLVTWDIVLDPSVSIAKLNQVKESVNKDLPPEKQIKGNFLETENRPEKVTVPVTTDIKNEIKNKPEQEKKRMEEKLEKLNDALLVKSTSLATAEANLKSMSEKVEDKNREIAKFEKANQTLGEKIVALEKDANEAADLLQKLADEKKDLARENKELKAKVEEFEKTEGEAIELINTQQAKIKEYEGVESEAIAVIEKLSSMVEQPASGPEKDDTSKGAAGKDKTKGEKEGASDSDSEMKEDGDSDEGPESESDMDEPEPLEPEEAAPLPDDGSGKSQVVPEAAGDSDSDGEKKKDEPKSEKSENGKLSFDATMDILEGALTGKKVAKNS
jgi:hypothetical protein